MAPSGARGPTKASNGEDSKRSTSKTLTTSQQEMVKSSAALSPCSSTSSSSSSRRHKDAQAPAASKQNGSNGKPVVKLASVGSASETVPIVNVNVKETVQVFNQIAALREKSKPTSPTGNHHNSHPGHRQAPPADAVSGATASSATSAGERRDHLGAAGGQIYRQRSIRATLAPKYATGNGGELAPKVCGEAGLSSSDSSSAGSSSNANANDNGGSKQHSNKMADQMPSKGSQAGGNGRLLSNHHQHQPQSGGQQQQSYVKGSKSRNHNNNHHHQQQQQQQQQMRGIGGHSDSSHSHTSSSSQSHLDQVTTNESYVSVLNHCFDDIEKFIIRLQQAVAAIRELQSKRKPSKRAQQASLDIGGGGGGGKASDSVYGSTKAAAANNGGGQQQLQLTASELALLNSRARGPSEDDYFEILSKFKLAFNLLAKLKGCIHEPNAPELVHFLFTPLAIIIESARNATPPIDPTLVGIPYLNQDALDLLSNCCTSKESDMWLSLGPNWTQTIDMSLLKASRLPSSFQPIFSDGWAPIIGELELIGLVGGSSAQQSAEPDMMMANHQDHHQHQHHQQPPVPAPPVTGREYKTGKAHIGAPSPPPPPLPLIGSDPRHHHHHQQHPLDSYLNSAVASGQYGASGDGYHMAHEPPADSLHAAGREHHRHRQMALSGQPGEPGQAGGGRRASGSKQGGHDHRRRQQQLQDDYPNYDPSLAALGSRGYNHALDVDEDGQLDMDGQLMVGQRMHSTDGYAELQPDHHFAPLPADELHHRQQRHSRSHYHQHQAQVGARYQRPMPAGPSHTQHYRLSSADKVGKLPAAPLYAVGQSALPPFEGSRHYLSEPEHDAILVDLGPAQAEWLFELQARGAMIVRVLFTREANNDKELSVRRGEILEILDDTRKWWRARNIDLQVAHVPHTIVALMHGYQTLDELLANNPAEIMANEDEETNLMNSALAQQRFQARRAELPSANYLNQHQWHHRPEDKRNSKTAGAFRYF